MEVNCFKYCWLMSHFINPNICDTGGLRVKRFFPVVDSAKMCHSQNVYIYCIDFTHLNADRIIILYCSFRNTLFFSKRNTHVDQWCNKQPEKCELKQGGADHIFSTEKKDVLSKGYVPSGKVLLVTIRYRVVFIKTIVNEVKVISYCH